MNPATWVYVAVVLPLGLLAGGSLTWCMWHPHQGSRRHRQWMVVFAVSLSGFMGAVIAFLSSIEGSR